MAQAAGILQRQQTLATALEQFHTLHAQLASQGKLKENAPALEQILNNLLAQRAEIARLMEAESSRPISPTPARALPPQAAASAAAAGAAVARALTPEPLLVLPSRMAIIRSQEDLDAFANQQRADQMQATTTASQKLQADIEKVLDAATRLQEKVAPTLKQIDDFQEKVKKIAQNCRDYEFEIPASLKAATATLNKLIGLVNRDLDAHLDAIMGTGKARQSTFTLDLPISQDPALALTFAAFGMMTREANSTVDTAGARGLQKYAALQKAPAEWHEKGISVSFPNFPVDKMGAIPPGLAGWEGRFKQLADDAKEKKTSINFVFSTETMVLGLQATAEGKVVLFDLFSKKMISFENPSDAEKFFLRQLIQKVQIDAPASRSTVFISMPLAAIEAVSSAGALRYKGELARYENALRQAPQQQQQQAAAAAAAPARENPQLKEVRNILATLLQDKAEGHLERGIRTLTTLFGKDKKFAKAVLSSAMVAAGNVSLEERRRLLVASPEKQANFMYTRCTPQMRTALFEGFLKTTQEPLLVC